MESEKSPNMTRNIAIGIGVTIVVIGFIVFAVAKSKSNVVATSTSTSVQAPTPVDCEYTWSDWNCNGSKSTRTARVTTQPSGGGQACPAPEIKDCNNCVYTWDDWNCNGSKSTRTAKVTKQPSGGGQACPDPQIKDCNDCVYTWDDWKCDNTTKKATRNPKVTKQPSGGGQACPDPQIQDCNDCEVIWGDWKCNNDTGIATKTPLVIKQPSGNGKQCPDPQTQQCSNCKYTWDDWKCDSNGNATKSPNITAQAFGGGEACPVAQTQKCNDCQYTWGNWICDDTTGIATRNPIVSKAASVGGKACPDPEKQACSNCKFTWNDTVCDTTTGKSLKSLNITTEGFGGGIVCPQPITGSCARDCQFSWGDWQCDRTTGISKRDPVITASPLGSGQQCPKTDLGTCAKDCQYTWGDWQCDKTTGVKKRSPNITSTALNGGLACPAPETGLCDVDCVVNYPTTWGVCDPATGKQSMTGTVATIRQNNGRACDPLLKTQDCKVDCQVAWSNVFGPCNYLTQTQAQNGVVGVTAKNGGAPCGDLTQLQNCTPAGPYVYTTQVFAGQNPLTGFSQTGVPPNWGSGKVTTYGGLCVIDLNFTAWSPTSINTGVFALIIDGVAQLPLITFCFNSAGQHFTIPSVFLSLYLSPGVHTFSLCINYNMTNTPIAVDNFDYMWLRVVEYSQQLIAGPNPSVYVTNVFNQTPPTTDTTPYKGPGIPPGWTKTVVTNGGVVVVDLNFTAYAKTIDQHIYFALMIDGNARTPLIYWYNYVYTDNHKTIPANFTLYQLPAGTHTFAISTNYGTSGTSYVDASDTLNMRITEFSSSLTLQSLVTIIPITSMVTRTGGGYANSNIIGRTFTTYGGTCLFNMSCSAWVNAAYTPNDGNVIGFAFKFSNINSRTSILNSNNTNGVTTSYYGDNGNSLVVNNYFYMNVRTEHRVINCNFIIDNLPAGTHDITIIGIGQAYVDNGDTVNIRLIEFSPTLTSGTPPALPTALTATTKPNFKGCYTDNVNSNRVFNQMVDNQTLAQCNAVAKTANSPYFGMQNWQKSGGISAMDTGECWFGQGSTLSSSQSQGSSTSCAIGTAGYNIGGANTNAVYQTL
jgi:hypothetical protein